MAGIKKGIAFMPSWQNEGMSTSEFFFFFVVGRRTPSIDWYAHSLGIFLMTRFLCRWIAGYLYEWWYGRWPTGYIGNFAYTPREQKVIEWKKPSASNADGRVSRDNNEFGRTWSIIYFDRYETVWVIVVVIMVFAKLMPFIKNRSSEEDEEEKRQGLLL